LIWGKAITHIDLWKVGECILGLIYKLLVSANVFEGRNIKVMFGYCLGIKGMETMKIKMYLVKETQTKIKKITIFVGQF